MEAMKSEHPVMEMADALEVSASGYAEHLKKDERPRRREDEELGEKLTAIFKANRKTYGAPRLQIALGQQGIRCGKQRIARLQRRFGLHPAQKRRFRPRTTQSDSSLPVAKNELAKVPAPDRPNQIWVADITYIETREDWLYLAGILDLYSRKVAGWNTSDSLATELVTNAWKKAWKNTAPILGCYTTRIEDASMPARSSETCWLSTKQGPR
jgi:transposase InsO family protein